jgi:hypothetical protein
MSVIKFSLPAMWRGVIGRVLVSFSLRARAWMRCAETRDPREARRRTHPTVGELSLNRATRFSRRLPQTDSITSHRNSKPAISKSDLVICSSLYSCLTAVGHSHRKTVGVHAAFSPKMTPPTPCDEASHTPIKSGHPPTSLRHLVGESEDSLTLRRVLQPEMAASRTGFQCR